MNTIIILIIGLALSLIAFFLAVEALYWLYYKWRGRTATEDNVNLLIVAVIALILIVSLIVAWIILGWDPTIPITLLVSLGFILLFEGLIRWLANRETRRIMEGILAERDRKKQSQNIPIGSKVSQGGGEN